MPNSSGSLPVAKMLPGLHRVRRTRGDRHYEYWYAWRGGPQILSASAGNPAALAREVAKLAPAAIAGFTDRSRPVDDVTLYGLITQYLELLATDKVLADRTKRDRRKHLDIVRKELGEMTLRALSATKARPFLLDWRDQRAATPKTADDLLGALSLVLNWAVERGVLATNPLANFPRIYSVNRADIIWRPEQVATVLAHADPDVADAIRLAVATGLRKEDLIALPWSAVKDHAIVWQTGKSRGRRTVVIPMTDTVREALAGIERGDCITVLRSSKGTPWKPPGNGLDSGVRRARAAANAHAAKIHGEGTTAGLEGLRFHDLRGTAATRYILDGLPLDDVATILGWSLERVEEIARRYVTAEAIGMGMVARLKGTRTERQL